MSREDRITDQQMLDVFSETEGEAGHPPEVVAVAMRDLIEILWAEPDPERAPGEQLQDELAEVIEFLEEETVRLVEGMRKVLEAYQAGALPWTNRVDEALREAAEAVAEELNPDPPRQKLEETMAEGGAAPGKRSVLVVAREDPPWRASLEEALGRLTPAEPAIQEASSGDQLAAGPSSAHLVVVDESLSDSTLLDSLRAFRETDPWTPMLLITPEAGSRKRRQAIAAGANKVLAKPFSADRLARELEPLWA